MYEDFNIWLLYKYKVTKTTKLFFLESSNMDDIFDINQWKYVGAQA